MSQSLAATRADPWEALRAASPPLLLGLLLLGGIFRQEVATAVAVWDSSTAYNHCFLVLPVVAWLAYDRRDRVAGLPVRPLPWAVALAVPLAAVWLASERLGIMEGRQFVALACAELLVLAVLGWRLVRALAAPLLYLVFLVPFGAFLTTPLQDFTVAFIVHGLDLLGIANFSDGYTIEIPEGVFFVAQACAGLRFLIAAVAFGAVYAVMLYRSPWRRLAFMAACVVVPVLANGVRAMGIVVAGHLIGSAQAAAADHLIYGWLFFCLVLGLLILAGLPFRQDGQRIVAARMAPQPRVRATRLVLPVVVLAILAAAGPVVAGRLDQAAATTPVSAPATLAGCVPAAADPGLDAASRAILARSGAATRAFLCQDGKLRIEAVAFPPATNPMLILSAQRSLTGQLEAEDVQTAPLRDAGATGWQGIKTTNPDRISATALWIGGLPAAGGLHSRWEQARNSVVGTDRAVLLAVADGVGADSLTAILRLANAAGLSAQLATTPVGR